MARELFTYIVYNRDTVLNTINALKDVQYSVRQYDFDTNTYSPVQGTRIYNAKTGNSKKRNPGFTRESGEISFYADYGLYKIIINDPESRIADKEIIWRSTPNGPNSLPSNIILPDGNLLFDALGNRIHEQMVQVGQVISWWRPSDTIPVPTGFHICDGSSVDTEDHEFEGVGNITLPDLQNKFILGAERDKAYGYPACRDSALIDQQTSAPGIGSTTTKVNPVNNSEVAQESSHVRGFSHEHTIGYYPHNSWELGQTTHNGVSIGDSGNIEAISQIFSFS